MSFLKGKVKEISGTPKDIRGLRGTGATWANEAYAGRGPLAGAFGQVPDYTSTADNEFFLKSLLKPYQDMFTAQRGNALSQAKESAGNLTGSGYNNILGSQLESSLAGEQSTLAQVLNALRGQEIQRQTTLRGQDLGRQSDLLRFILSLSTAGVGPPTAAYQPGLLDSVGNLVGNLAGSYLAGRGQQQTVSAPPGYGPGNPFFIPSTPPSGGTSPGIG